MNIMGKVIELLCGKKKDTEIVAEEPEEIIYTPILGMIYDEWYIEVKGAEIRVEEV